MKSQIIGKEQIHPCSSFKFGRMGRDRVLTVIQSVCLCMCLTMYERQRCPCSCCCEIRKGYCYSSLLLLRNVPSGGWNVGNLNCSVVRRFGKSSLVLKVRKIMGPGVLLHEPLALLLLL